MADSDSDKTLGAPAETPWWRLRWVQNAGLILLAAAVVYGAVAWDVVRRAKAAYMQGELHMHWHREPGDKQAHFEEIFAREKARLDRALARRKITLDEHRRQLDTLAFDRDFRMGESSLKYAYQWYKDAFELFRPPESRWVRSAREKAPEALALWKEELREKKIPFEDYMFE